MKVLQMNCTWWYSCREIELQYLKSSTLLWSNPCLIKEFVASWCTLNSCGIISRCKPGLSFSYNVSEVFRDVSINCADFRFRLRALRQRKERFEIRGRGRGGTSLMLVRLDNIPLGDRGLVRSTEMTGINKFRMRKHRKIDV